MLLSPKYLYKLYGLIALCVLIKITINVVALIETLLLKWQKKLKNYIPIKILLPRVSKNLKDVLLYILLKQRLILSKT